MTLFRSSIIVAGIFLAGMAIAEESPVVAVKRLTLDAAQGVAQATVEECRKQGVQVTATVVDKNGTVQAVLRDTLAPPISLQISKEKAYTAANFSVATSQLTDLSASPIGAVDGLTMSAGGVLIEAGGTIYGAVGVSGAPSGETDEACAMAGVQAVVEDLEMMN
ncbi:MAG: heme-binding protein [Gammaproteobacteria bacterium]|nr:heme-binding protein [Gammaproteobacteria bacterium]